MKKHKGPKILVYDIETAPIIAHVWKLWDNNVGLNQIETDWHLLSYAAKWLDQKRVMYKDQRSKRDITNDKEILKEIWKLLDEADVVITKNGKHFDEKKLNARFILNGFQPPSSYKHIDVQQVVKKKFGFTSNKLEYLTKKLCKKYKKLDHKRYPGHELWTACLKGDIKAWKEMEKYNKFDVLSTEELYHIVIPWDTNINFNLYRDDLNHICKCGSEKLLRNGFAYTPKGRYQRYRCKECGAEVRGTTNELSARKRKSLKLNIK